MKEFKDEMYTVLSQQYTTHNGSTIRVKVLLDVVDKLPCALLGLGC